MINLQLVYMYIDLLRFFFVFFGLTRSIELIRMGHWHRCLKKNKKKICLHSIVEVLLYI